MTKRFLCKPTLTARLLSSTDLLILAVVVALVIMAICDR